MNTCDFVTSGFSAYVTWCDRRHFQILHCQYRVSWHRYVSRSATYWKAVESAVWGMLWPGLWTIWYSCAASANAQRYIESTWRQHLRKSLCFSEQSHKWFVIIDDAKLATPSLHR